MRMFDASINYETAKKDPSLKIDYNIKDLGF